MVPLVAAVVRGGQCARPGGRGCDLRRGRKAGQRGIQKVWHSITTEHTRFFPGGNRCILPVTTTDLLIAPPRSFPPTDSTPTASERRQILGLTDIDLRSICTSHVERNNLTIRTFMKRFTRLSLGFSKKLENLAAAVALHVAYYNFILVHSTTRVTPAMAAGVTDHVWKLDELLAAL